MSFYIPKPINPYKHTFFQDINLTWLNFGKFILYLFFMILFFLIIFISYFMKDIDLSIIIPIINREIIDRYLFDFSAFIFMFYFFLNWKRVIQTIVFITIISLIYILHLFISKPEVIIHILIIWSLSPFILIYCANEHLLDIPFKFFIGIHTHTINGIDLFTNARSFTTHHTRDDIYIDVFVKDTNFKEKKFIEIKTQYLRLIKFWYTQRNYLFKLRFFFPLLMFFIGSFYFFYLLYYVHNYAGIEILDQRIIMGISLILFFLTMSYHINNFLDSKFYMGNILIKLNKIDFDDLEYRQQLRLFFDKHLLVYIHDRIHDRHFCVNKSKNFQDFILKEKQDEEGRNMIITVYTTFIMILFIEIFVNVSANKPLDNSNTTPISQTIKEIIDENKK